jgi:hypothetical protein
MGINQCLILEMDDFDRIRELIRHENELINQRLTWLGTFQGLLLAALAFAWDKKSAGGIVCVLCTVGAMVAISTGVATRRANRAIDDQTAAMGRY